MLNIKDYIPLAGFAITIILVIVNIVKTHAIKNNDLAHLEVDVKELRVEVKGTTSKIVENTTKLARIEGYLFGKAEEKK